MSPFNILFTSSGRRVSLIQHFKRVLIELGLDGKIVTADLRKDAPTAFVGDFHEQVPRVTDPDYIPALFEICNRYSIKLLIPLIDTELLLLSEQKDMFQAHGVTVLVCSSEANRICRDKNKTAAFFRSIGIDTPKILQTEEILANKSSSYPYLIKPFDGSSSIGVTKVTSPEELYFFSEYIKNAILQEFIYGEEYTIDALVDFDGRVRSIVPRLRLETRAGEVSKGMTVKDKKIISAVKTIADSLPGALGCLTIQCFITAKGDIKFIEINPRFGGGFPLTIEAGADFPRWIIEMMIGRDPEINIDQWKHGVVMLRYDDAIFTSGEKIK